MAPANPGAYLTAALGVGNAAAQHKQFVAKHKVLQSSYANYLGMEKASKELILYAVGDNIRNPELFNRNHLFITILFTELIATV